MLGKRKSLQVVHVASKPPNRPLCPRRAAQGVAQRYPSTSGVFGSCKLLTPRLLPLNIPTDHRGVIGSAAYGMCLWTRSRLRKICRSLRPQLGTAAVFTPMTSTARSFPPLRSQSMATIKVNYVNVTKLLLSTSVRIHFPLPARFPFPFPFAFPLPFQFLFQIQIRFRFRNVLKTHNLMVSETFQFY